MCDGLLVNSQVFPSSNFWVLFKSPVFKATSPTHTFEFSGAYPAYDDLGTAIDAVSISPVVATAPGVHLQNGSFEAIPLGDRKWLYIPHGVYPDWTYMPQSGGGDTGSGIAMFNSTWAATASDGRQLAFLQRGAFIQQTITNLVVGRGYQVVFSLSSRPGLGGNSVQVKVNNSGALTHTNWNSSSWTTIRSAAFTARATTAVLRIESTDPGYDATSLIDNVRIVEGGLGR